MSSSISSSKPANESRRIFAKMILAIVIGMTMALVLVRLFVAAHDVGSQSLLGRVLQATDAIPKIAKEEKDLVMFFGSSMVQAGFSPREFDRDLATRGVDVKSFNFGFGGLNPLFQDYLSRRIAEGFNAHDRRMKLAVIEFNPFQTTITRRQGALALEESYIALLASPGELFQILLEDPERGLRMLQIRYLRDGISAEMITTFFWGEPFETPTPKTGLVEAEGVEEQLNTLQEELNKRFEAEYPDYDGSDWFYPWQGGGTIKDERPPETIALFSDYYALTQTDFKKDQARLRRVQSADIEQLNFDPELVDAFILIVKNLQQIADHVEVVMLPKNTVWIKNPPEALARQAAVVEKIRRETGVPFRDFQHIDVVSEDMFSDTTHLNRYRGAVVFTQFLADFYADQLK